MLRDWSFEGRAFLEKNPDYAAEKFGHLVPKPAPNAPPVARSSSKLQSLSMDPESVAAAPLRDLDAWGVGGSAKIEVATLPISKSPMTNQPLHALCMRQPADGALVQAVNAGHSLEGFYLGHSRQYVLSLRVRSGVRLVSVLATSPDGGTSYFHQTFTLTKVTAQLMQPPGIQGFGDFDDLTEWVELRASVTASVEGSVGSAHARLAVRFRGPGALCVDYVSLTPAEAWSSSGELRPLAPPLVNALRPLRPRFLRFPGGAAVEGATLLSAYDWRTTVGPRELRPGHPNANWGYWNSDSLGLHEMFDLAEDLGAEPVWVLNVGISQSESLSPKMAGAHLEDAMASLEYILGPENTPMGAKRAQHGRPRPWALRYVALGNEECKRPWYYDNYRLFSEEIRRAYGTRLQLVSNCDFGTFHEAEVDMWEFHSYWTGGPTFELAAAFDQHQGTKRVAVSEFAVMPEEHQPAESVLTAIAEAALMAALERNCQKVTMIAFAPLLRHARLTRWKPTLLVFDEDGGWYHTPSFVIQEAFAKHSASGLCLAASVSGRATSANGTRGVQASATCVPARSGKPRPAACKGRGARVAVKVVNFQDAPEKVILDAPLPRSARHFWQTGPQTCSVESVEVYSLSDASGDPAVSTHGFDSTAALAPRRDDAAAVAVEGGLLELHMPAFSMMVVTLRPY
ncbi:MAG: glycoside hydrolase superfamily [Monoraphidium minutum]|nr:MAG: glycoside hydrolase superfamily [Monoraphidium minutum]